MIKSGGRPLETPFCDNRVEEVSLPTTMEFGRLPDTDDSTHEEDDSTHTSTASVAEQLHISDSDSDSDSDFVSVLPRRFEDVLIFLRFVSTLPNIFARSEVSQRNQSI